ncbi:MAG: AbrB/MazE/SpoVT family DNA-binding domain-containing protein [Nanoarchaeota archaeon]|nr:AbrB/MazE/SpoVT family DNA-binding domain-containing protein [Nanoarchaeota archaeon]MBU1704036.1 AbrB/MazE/SpoVT family DNA-binding domain-containing protein [Nanoarchaeota archaeon]
MHTRKIQSVGGSTYSITLPKQWVIKNRLKEKDALSIIERNDMTLLVSRAGVTKNSSESISVNLEEYPDNIEQIIFTLYYLGIENINLFTKQEIAKHTRAQIRKALEHMGGTEIIYEDRKKISIKTLLDKSKVDIKQIIFRMSLIIESSINIFFEDFEIQEIGLNESELDRLYHLTAKIVTLSLINPEVLISSGIVNVSSIPSYLLICKRLENMGDGINHLAEYLDRTRVEIKGIKHVFDSMSASLKLSIQFLLNMQKKVYSKTPPETIKVLRQSIFSIKDRAIQDYLDDMLRFLINIEEETVNISFFNQLIAKGNL